MRVTLAAGGRSRSAVLPIGLLGLFLLVSGCTADGDAHDAIVVMYDDFFAPSEIRVEPGEVVRFRNRGRVEHNAIDLGGQWQTDLLAPGEEEEIAVDEPGVYRFYCSLHATRDGEGMAGTLVVGSPAEAGDDDPTAGQVHEWTGVTRRVPDDYPKIQAAVDDADPGDLVLVGPGVYREQVNVTVPSITIRGTDRNQVVVDAEHEREMGIIVIADGVAVENLTVRDARANGVYWRGVTGFRGSYLTAIGNVGYGIYAFDSSDGLFEHSYASGSADAGYYIGQCHPCRVVLDHVTAEYNGLGYSGTNAGGDLFIVNSLWQRNGAGIVPNTLDSQRDPPARNPTLIGNVVRDNGEPGVPYLSGTWPAFGNGIMLPGVRDAVVERNLVVDNRHGGIVVVANIDDNLWLTGANAVRDNLVRGSGRGDLVLTAPAAGGDCFADNDVGRTVPRALQSTKPCDGPRLPRLTVGPAFTLIGHMASRPEIDDLVARVAAQPEPGPQEQMPGGADADVRPAHDVFSTVALDPDAIDLPAWDGRSDGRAVALLLGVPVFSGTSWEVGLGLLGTLVPLLVYVAWVLVALVDLRREPARSPSARGAWTAAVLLVPLAGVLAYYVGGRPRLSRARHLALVAGPLVAWLAALAVAISFSGLL